MNWTAEWNRRAFLKTAGLASLLNTALPGSVGAAAARAARGASNFFVPKVYRELGLRPFINAAGTYTTLSASLQPREVLAAMNEAGRAHVDIPELQAAVGKRIAGLLGCEAALVTAGAAAALTLGTAACVTGKDPKAIRQIPDLTGLKKTAVIIQKSHRYGYDHAIRNVGVKMLEVETREELLAAASERTAMMLFFNANDPRGRIHAEEFVALGKKLGVPTFNDAAADTPPPERLTMYTRMGFDLVAFSGGKGLCGPQCSGLLLGRKDLVEAAFLNGNPFSDSIGRGAKVGKEEIVGLLTALELFLKRNHAAQWAEWERRVKYIADTVTKVPGVTAEREVPEIANQVPHLAIRWDPSKVRLTNRQVALELREGNPRIELRPGSDREVTPPLLHLGVWMMQPGEHVVLARRLREVLEKGARG